MLDEDHEDAGHRRLMEEMGFDCQMKKVTEFVYKVDVPPGLIEHEYLHVFVGLYNGETIHPNPEEVISYSRLTVDQLMQAIERDDRSLAPWTKITRRLAKDQMLEVRKSML
jgi:isopentenyl-diphosphate delta-isomerase